MGDYQDDEPIHIKEFLHYVAEFIAYFELAESKMNEWRQEIGQQAHSLQQQQHSLEIVTEKSLARISQHSEHLTQHISSQLSHYDPQRFQRIAHDSCEEVKRAANDAVHQSNKLLQMFQIRFNFFAVLTTILTAFIVVLYLNGELPWEMHHIAKNERQAGKALLQIWPKLNPEEKARILEYINNP